MLYWLSIKSKFGFGTIDDVPIPKDVAVEYKAAILLKDPKAIVTIEPAWEGPWESMPVADLVTTTSGSCRTGSKVLIYKITPTELWFFRGRNFRCGYAVDRKDGRRFSAHYSSLQITPKSLAALEAFAATHGGTWDSGWCPGNPNN